MSNLAGLDRQGLAETVGDLDPRRFVPAQLFAWIYRRRATDFDAMTDLNRKLRLSLAQSFEVRFPAAVETHAAEDRTVRYAFRLDDGARIESVYIPGEAGAATLCLSSQVGCPLACTFCVSGLDGVKRNLTTAEILGQARAMLADHPPAHRLNVVFMGMGEALLNLDNLRRAFSILEDDDGFGIALRRQTVSTAGHVAALERFACLPRRPRLAVSLNATTDEVRDRIMPINRTWPLAELLAACRRIPLRGAERITFEYVLLDGVNDLPADARRIPGLLHGLPAKLNLIPWNPAAGLPYRPPTDAAVERFADLVRGRGIPLTVRRRRGADANAACGQLAVIRSDPPRPG